MSWTQTSSPQVNWSAACISDDGNKIYGHDGTNIYRSLNGGSTWNAVYSISNLQRNMVCSYNGVYILTVAYVAGINNRIIFSSDSGSTWTQLSFLVCGYGAALSGDGKYIYAVGGYNSGDGSSYIYVSSNYGNTFTKTSSISITSPFWPGAATVMRCNSTGSNVIFYYTYYNGSTYPATDESYMLASNNYGTTWSGKIGLGGFANLFNYWVAMDASGSFALNYACAGSSMGTPYLIKSYNGGFTWSAGQTPPDAGPFGMQSGATAKGGDIIFVDTNGGGVKTSVDGGTTWISSPRISVQRGCLACSSTGMIAIAAPSATSMYKYYAQLKLSYNGNGSTGGTLYPDASYNYTATITVPEQGGVLRQYYGFIGWNTTANGSGTTYKTGDTFQLLDNTTLYAQWSSIRCFKEDSTILCLIDGQETYVPVQDIQNGTLVKTYLSGYVPVAMIGHSKIYNPNNSLRSKNRLFRYSKNKFPELTEDLIITGCHSILVPHLTETQRALSKELTGDVYVTDNLYRLIAVLDENSEPYEEEGIFNIWHIALDNDDDYSNYGIYANGGLLVETSSKRMMTHLSGLELK